jgi:hypothetical protein
MLLQGPSTFKAGLYQWNTTSSASSTQNVHEVQPGFDLGEVKVTNPLTVGLIWLLLELPEKLPSTWALFTGPPALTILTTAWAWYWFPDGLMTVRTIDSIHIGGSTGVAVAVCVGSTAAVPMGTSSRIVREETELIVKGGSGTIGTIGL